MTNEHDTANGTRLTSVYRHVGHAAHYGATGAGHDLDEWDVTAETRPTAAQAGIPLNAEWHHGYRDAAGRRHWVFNRIAPFSSQVRCERCIATGEVRK